MPLNSSSSTKEEHPVRRRRSPKGDASRERIIDVAEQQFSTQGYRGTSLGKVADGAGLSKAALIHHFPTKEALLLAVLHDRVGMDGDEMTHLERPEAGSAPLDEYLDLVERRLDETGWIQLYTVFLGESLHAGHPAAEYMQTRISRLRAVIERSLRAGIQEGRFREAINVPATAASLLALTDGIRIQVLLDPNFDARKGLRSAAEAIVDHLAP